MARMILLGVGTAVPDVDRDCTHMVWDGPGGPLLIDAGGSTYQRLLKAGIDPLDLRGVLLTHSHTDHINGIPALFFALALRKRQEPLLVYGLEPTLTMVQQIIAAFQMEQHQPPVQWQPFEAGATLPLSPPDDVQGAWMIRTALTLHTRPCVALRFEHTSSGAALCYSCDTAPTPTVVELATGAQTLIHEASLAEPTEIHTTPRQAGKVAQQAGVGRLVLVHYSPQWTMPEAQALAEVKESGFAGQAEIGREYQSVDVGD
jgi:ribonuclease Z